MRPRAEPEIDDLYNRSYLASFSSVIIILLTFFIYFNSISSLHPERSEQLRRSIKSEFVPTRKAEAPKPELLELFTTEVLSPLRLVPNRGPGSLVTRISAKRMFFNGEHEISADFTPLLDALVKASKTDGCSIEIDVFARHAPDNWQTALLRTGTLSRYFSDAGLNSAEVLARWADPSPGAQDAPDHIRVALFRCAGRSFTGETQ